MWAKQADALRNNFYALDAALRADKRYTDETRLSLRCRLYLDTQKQLAALRPQHEDTIAAQHRELQRGVFSHPDDPESYRLALDAVAPLDSPAKLARRLQLAEKTGDETTAAAIMAVAAERSDGSAVVAQYLARRPDKAEQYGRLKDHESQAAPTYQDRLFSPWRVAVPSDLPKGNNGTIERLAASVESTPVAL
jgi:hypothetical protein